MASLLLTPMERAILDARSEQIALFDRDGRLSYLNAAARSNGAGADPAKSHPAVRAELLAHGGRAVPLVADATPLGEAVIVTPNGATLAEQERNAVREALERCRGNRSEAARQLGISRTTLWRRLTGKHRNGKGPHKAA